MIPQHSGVVLKGDGPSAEIVVQGENFTVGIWETDPAVRFEGLTITGGGGYGGIYAQTARVEIVDCVLRGNDGPGDCHGVGGGGRIVSGSDVLVTGCTIEENHDWEAPGGLIVWSSRADIRGNVFRNNSSCYGGGLELYHCEGYGVMLIEDNVFVGNAASDWGGGLFNVDSSPVIRRNTFVDNGGFAKAAIWVLGGKPEISHNIIVDSHYAVFCQAEGGYPPSLPVAGDNICWAIADTTLSNCGATGSLHVVDPLFCDREAGDYRLCADSPAIQGEEVVFGALGVGCPKCGETPARKMNWGSVKALFGEQDRR